MTWLLVAVGAALGAPLRYLLDRMIQARHDSVFPWGTFTVNLAGSFVLGALAGAAHHLPGQLSTLVGTGFCGALTTYSTFGYETIRLTQNRARLLAVLNAAGTVVAGLGAALLGYTLTRAL